MVPKQKKIIKIPKKGGRFLDMYILLVFYEKKNENLRRHGCILVICNGITLQRHALFIGRFAGLGEVKSKTCENYFLLTL